MVGMDPPGRLGRDAGRALAGDRAQDVDVVGGQVERHPDVADPGRERPRATARDGEDRRQPAGLEHPPELEDRRVEPLDMADLDRRRAGRAMPRRRSDRLPPIVEASGFSTRTAIPRSIAARVSGRWLVVGAAMTTASRSASASMASGSRRAGRRTVRSPRRARPAPDPRRPPGGRRAAPPRTRRWLRPIVPRPISPTRTSRSPTGDQAPVIGRRLPRRAAVSRPASAPARDARPRTAAITVPWSSSGEPRDTSAATGSARTPGRSPAGRRGCPRSSTYGWRWTGIG